MARLFPVRVVSRRTGLSPHVLRVWERRYGAVAPQRSSGNRRLYSETELQRLESLAFLTRAAHAISQISSLNSKNRRHILAVVAREFQSALKIYTARPSP
ncbi:MAG TPA: MerR family transcriptional regulator [Verrucomicrobiales bacterium]|nr:MerR family transcriptional regulator [Verrucomicrobiales bacterium]